MAYGYGAEILRGAGQGAQTGAGIGGTVGTIAGGQTAIGAGLGAGVGAIAGGIRGAVQGRKNPQRNELEELLRRQEMDALGLTDEERRIMETQLVDPLATQFRQQQAMAPTQMSSGVAARMMMAQQQAQNLARAAAAQKIAQADIAERVREEDQIRGLEKDLYDQRKTDAAEAGKAALDAAATYMQAEAFQGRVDAMKEEQARILALGEGLQQEGMESTPQATSLLNSAREAAGIIPDGLPSAGITPDGFLPASGMSFDAEMAIADAMDAARGAGNLEMGAGVGAALTPGAQRQALRQEIGSGLSSILNRSSDFNSALGMIPDTSYYSNLSEEERAFLNAVLRGR